MTFAVTAVGQRSELSSIGVVLKYVNIQSFSSQEANILAILNEELSNPFVNSWVTETLNIDLVCLLSHRL